MRISRVLGLGLFLVACSPAWGQALPRSTPAVALPPGALVPGPVNPTTGVPAAAMPSLTKFSLEFPGGAPKDLVAAIEKATGRPLNAIVPDEFNDVQLPMLKMNHVDVSQLFGALAASSRKGEALDAGRRFPGGFGGMPNNEIGQIGYGFRTSDRALSDDSIWYFYAEKPVTPPPPAPPSAPTVICKFYSLEPYLAREINVDDITTAIETGWKMLGYVKPPPGPTPSTALESSPSISFHKDTKLLIAVGEPSKLETIDAVLKALNPSPAGPGLRFTQPAPVPPPKSGP